MIGSLPARPKWAAPLAYLVGLAAFGFALGLGPNPSTPGARGQEPAPGGIEALPGQFFKIEEPIDSATLERIQASTRQLLARSSANKSARPILVFEIRPGRTQPGSSSLGVCSDLASFISTDLAGARMTVAYIPEPLKGYAVLPALACDEVVMGPDASIGPITPEGQAVRNDFREPVSVLARRKGREPDLYLGMLDRDADLKVVRTADRQVHYVLGERLAAFLKDNPAAADDIKPAWEGGNRGLLTARRARDEGFSKLTAEDRSQIANAYRISAGSLAEDPTLLQDPKPVWIHVEGRIDPIKESYLRRRVDQARREGVNLVFFSINSPGGLQTAADNLAGMIADIKDMKTVAFVDDRALGVAALIPLACDDIVFRKGGRMGDAHQLLTGGRGRVQELSPGQIETLARRAEGIAAKKGHPPALAHAMVDPDSKIVRATDAHSASAVLILESQLQAEPARFTNPTTIKDPGRALIVRAEEAEGLGLGKEVDEVEAFKALYGLRGKAIRVDGPTWVDGLVTTLNDPFISWVLLFIGVFMLILEIKMPGVGLPAITSALAFLLFFWSRYLSGTADQLEILLFLVGLVCLGLELFVFPGFGVFGFSGFLLIVVSIVMASHTFVWPTQEYEYRQMAGTLLQIVGVMAGVGVCATLVGRYLPSLPLLNRMVLQPEPYVGEESDDPTAKPPATEGYESFHFLLGETGRTTTVLRPSGKARFGSLLVDVRADGFYIDRDALVEVVEVQGMRVIVKPVA